MRILVSGATGLAGSALCRAFRGEGHEVVALSRKSVADGIHWDPSRGEIDAAALDGLDVVIHLAGANIAAARWTRERRREILASRVEGTRLLVGALRKAGSHPRVFLSASAVGYYGDTGESEVDENSPAGTGFLAEVCQRWEAEAAHAGEMGVRTVFLRTGIILTAAGGALGKLLPLFKAGLGGPAGNGRQWMSWISMTDFIGVVRHLIAATEVSGPVNVVSPQPVRNAEFGRTLGRVLGRPAFTPAPAIALKLAFGRMAEETVLASNRVRPGRLLESAYQFQYDSLESALRHALGRGDG